MKTSSRSPPLIDCAKTVLQQATQRFGTQPCFLKLPQVKSMTTLSRATIYRRMKEDDFPKAIRLGTRLTVWIDLEVSAWIEQQIARRRS